MDRSYGTDATPALIEPGGPVDLAAVQADDELVERFRTDRITGADLRADPQMVTTLAVWVAQVWHGVDGTDLAERIGDLLDRAGGEPFERLHIIGGALDPRRSARRLGGTEHFERLRVDSALDPCSACPEGRHPDAPPPLDSDVVVTHVHGSWTYREPVDLGCLRSLLADYARRGITADVEIPAVLR